jgi:hypothetical protein
MSQSDKPPAIEKDWATVVKALKRLTTDAEVKRLLANPECSAAFVEYLKETSLPQLQTLSSLRNLLFHLSRSFRPTEVYRNTELRITLKPSLTLNGKAMQVSVGILEMCGLLGLRVIPAKGCGRERGRLKFELKGLLGRQWAAISFGIEEEPH